jgi:hypothetical protein
MNVSRPSQPGTAAGFLLKAVPLDQVGCRHRQKPWKPKEGYSFD